jgi:hypothetical protein
MIELILDVNNDLKSMSLKKTLIILGLMIVSSETSYSQNIYILGSPSDENTSSIISAVKTIEENFKFKEISVYHNQTLNPSFSYKRKKKDRNLVLKNGISEIVNSKSKVGYTKSAHTKLVQDIKFKSGNNRLVEINAKGDNQKNIGTISNIKHDFHKARDINILIYYFKDAPVLTLLNPKPGSTVLTKDISIKGYVSDNLEDLLISLNDGEFENIDLLDELEWSHELRGLSSGKNTIEFKMIRDGEEFMTKTYSFVLKNAEEVKLVNVSQIEFIKPKKDEVIEKCILHENQVPCYVVRFKINGDATLSDLKMTINNKSNNEIRTLKLSDLNTKFIRQRKFSSTENHYCVFLKCEDFGYKNCCEPYDDITSLSISQYGFSTSEITTVFFTPSFNPDVSLEAKCDCF